VSIGLVIPTVGRPELARLLDSLARSVGPRPDRVVVVDDRRGGIGELPLPDLRETWLDRRLMVRSSGGRGPAAARNVGWPAVDAEWIAFVDDDVVVSRTWLRDLDHDLRTAPDGVGGSQGRVRVPLPTQRRPTDWERSTAGLAGACWITADMAYRRTALLDVGGFDERFPRAFREDADLALRMLDAGYELVSGRRSILHPVRAAPWSASLRAQRGNADDALMRRLHGRHWAQRAGADVGRRPRHIAIVGSGLAAGALAATHRRGPALVAAAATVAGVAEFAWARIAPGPRDLAEVTRMIVTSVAIPPAAVGNWLRGSIRHRRAAPWPTPTRRIAAVLVDRDGTLVHDVPYNHDPARVVPIDGVAESLHRLRSAGLPVGVVTNQSGIARGLLDEAAVTAVNRKVDELLGPFAVWCVCPHGDADECGCRKPRPGLLASAAESLGVPVQACAMIGDTGADVAAAEAAGAWGLLVPNAATRQEEIASAGTVRSTFEGAVDAILCRSAAPL
jgi:histidinol-phosphate phosphatase family protein